MRLQIRSADAVAAAPLESLEGGRLTLLLHGLGADERDLLPLAPALGGGAIVSLRAPLAHGPGFAWAAPGAASVGSGRGLAPAADAVLAWLDGLAAAGPGSPAAVRLLGFSQGGALALTLLRRAPDRFERLVVLAGFVPDEPEVGDAALADGRTVPVLWGRGDADAVIPLSAIERTAAWLPAHTAVTTRIYPGLAHGISDAELDDVAAFLA